MHCEKCWEYQEELSCLKEKSNAKLYDWSNFLIELPQDLSKVCEDGIRENVWSALNDAPDDKFSFKDWWEFLNDSIRFHGIRFKELALYKMEVTAETPENRLNYEKIVQNLSKLTTSNSKKKAIVRI